MKQLSLLYHRVNDLRPDPWDLCVSPAHFAEQMEVVSHISPRPIVTFDDGYADNLHRALPILETYDISAIVFVASGAIESQVEMWWDALDRLFPEDFSPGSPYMQWFWKMRSLPFEMQEKQLNEAFSAAGISRITRLERRMMTTAELARLGASPLIQIGAHTITHPVLSSLALSDQEAEITGSKTGLEAILQKPVRLFAYPNGMHSDYTSDTVRLVRDAGFLAAYSAYQHDLEDPFQKPRFMVRDWDGDTFARDIRMAAQAAD